MKLFFIEIFKIFFNIYIDPIFNRVYVIYKWIAGYGNRITERSDVDHKIFFFEKISFRKKNIFQIFSFFSFFSFFEIIIKNPSTISYRLV